MALLQKVMTSPSGSRFGMARRVGVALPAGWHRLLHITLTPLHVNRIGRLSCGAMSARTRCLASRCAPTCFVSAATRKAIPIAREGSIGNAHELIDARQTRETRYDVEAGQLVPDRTKRVHADKYPPVRCLNVHELLHAGCVETVFGGGEIRRCNINQAQPLRAIETAPDLHLAVADRAGAVVVNLNAMRQVRHPHFASCQTRGFL
jgi:hypothetical protein